jgi:glycosyltransferase involved in cell wall biosynthesis
MRRIAFITDTEFNQVNGVVTTIANLRSELEQRGFEIVVIEPSQFRTVPYPKYPEIRIPINPLAIRRALKAADADAYHIFTEGVIGWTARLWLSRRGTSFTTSYHTRWPEFLRAQLRLPTAPTYALVRWFHRGAHRTLTTTDRMAQELHQRGFGTVSGWTRGVDRSTFKPTPSPFSQEWPRPIWLYVGRVSWEKNIPAFLNLPLPGTRVVVGDGPARATLESQYEDVKWLGVKRGGDLAACFSGSDVHVFPSLNDTFGVVMLEAMACGTPTAAFPVTGPLDVIEPGVTGYVNDDLYAACMAAWTLDRSTVLAGSQRWRWDEAADIFVNNLRWV